MNELFDKNLSALEKRWPDLYQELLSEIEKFKKIPQGDSQEQFQFGNNPNGTKNLIYRRDLPPLTLLYHSKDPEQEAQEVLDRTDLKYPTMAIFFGIGLGYLPKLFIKQRPKNNYAILVIEKNHQIFLRALCVHDFVQEFHDRTFFWILGPDVMKVRCALNSFFQLTTTVNRFIRILPTQAALQSEPEFYLAASKSILLMRDHTMLLQGNSVNDTFLGFQNTLQNLPASIQNQGLRILFNQFTGKTCISVAAGPSLNEHWETLKSIQGRIPIIAVDTVLKPMQEHGIVPDFITALERDSIVTNFFKGFPIQERTTLIAPTLILKESFDAFQGRILMYAPSSNYIENFGLSFLGCFHGGSSAGNLNLGLATAMGFQNIILVGHNLAYDYYTKTTHVSGTIDQDRERSRSEEELKQEASGGRVMTQDETDQVPTRIEWNLFRNQMEGLIAIYSDRTFVNTAPKGAFIQGAKLMTFQTALKELAQDPFDIWPQVRMLLKPVLEKNQQKRWRVAVQGAQKVWERLVFWYEQGNFVLEKIKQWKTTIEKTEGEGQKVSLHFLNQALDEMLALKVKAVNKDKLFYRGGISIISPAHLTFERMLNEMPGHFTDEYELKKKFLLEHETYFSIWRRWLPLIIQEFDGFLKKYKIRHRDLASRELSQSP